MMSSAPAKAEAPSSGPFAIFEAAAVTPQTDTPASSFAESMDRALESPTQSTSQKNPGMLSPEAETKPATEPMPSAKGVPVVLTRTPQFANCQNPAPQNQENPDTGGSELIVKVDQPPSDALAEIEEKESPAVADSENTTRCPKAESISLETICSVLLLSSVIPPLPQPQQPQAQSNTSDSLPEEPSLLSGSALENGSEYVSAPLASQAVPDKAPVSQPTPIFNNRPSDAQAADRRKVSEPSLPEANPLLSKEPLPLGSKETGPPPAPVLPGPSSPAEERSTPIVVPSGTGIAKKDLQMKKTAENDLKSPPGDLCLPSAATLSARAAVSAVATAGRTKDPISPDLDKLAAVAAFSQNSAPVRETAPVPENSPVAEPKAIEQLEQKILHSAIELKRLGNDSMSVVLRPDHQTEVHLSLVMNEGQVDVAARVSRGDLGHFQAEWGTLQQNLAQQGIRLQPMEQSRDFAQQQGEKQMGDSSHFQRQDSGDSNRRKAMLEEEMAASQFQFATRTAAGRRLWESWA